MRIERVINHLYYYGSKWHTVDKAAGAKPKNRKVKVPKATKAQTKAARR